MRRPRIALVILLKCCCACQLPAQRIINVAAKGAIDSIVSTNGGAVPPGVGIGTRLQILAVYDSTMTPSSITNASATYDIGQVPGPGFIQLAFDVIGDIGGASGTYRMTVFKTSGLDGLTLIHDSAPFGSITSFSLNLSGPSGLLANLSPPVRFPRLSAFSAAQFTITSVGPSGAASVLTGKIDSLSPSPFACEVNLPNRWGQADPPWGSLTYDSYNVAICTSQPLTPGECKIGIPGTCCRMTNLGCSTTALAMALSAAGVASLPDPVTRLNPLDPGSLNNFMNFGVDYTSKNRDVDWLKTTGDVNYLTLSLRGGKSIFFDQTLRGDRNPEDLRTAVCNGQPVVVAVGSGGPSGEHFVVVTGENDDADGNPHFEIVDPGHRAVTSLDTYVNAFTIRGVVSDPTDVSAFEVETDDGVELLVSDANGRQTGFDPIGSIFKKEILRSSYGQDVLTDNDTGESGGITRSIDIFQPTVGTFQILVTGLELGAFRLSIVSFSSDGSPQPEVSVAGLARIGSNSSFQIHYSPAPGSTPIVTRVASFTSTLSDINNSLQLGLIDNEGIANALSAKIEAASDALVRGDQSTTLNVLHAFKNQVSAQAGKHITGIAPQVLQDDADSLLMR